MGAATLLLMAKGAQDKHLTGQPQMSFWRAQYRRHTPFSLESCEVTMQGDTSWGGLCKATLDARGDLIADCYLAIELPELSVTGPVPLVRWTPKLGHAIIKHVDFVIGGEVIERHTGEWLELSSQLMLSQEKQKAYNNLIGHKGTTLNEAQYIPAQFIYVPLNFFFNRRVECALPALAIQCQEIEIRVRLREAHELYQTFHPDNVVACSALENISLFVDYVYLSDPERYLLLNRELSYLVETVQCGEQTEIGGSRGNTVDLSDFSGPVKELIFVVQRVQAASSAFRLNEDDWPDYNDWFNYGSSATPGEQVNMLDSIVLQTNGMDVVSKREPQFFNLYLPFKRHTSTPNIGVYVYSFALQPEAYQPSGTAEFSRLESAQIKVEFNDMASLPCVMRVFAYGYNVLRVSGGQSALSYVM